MLATLIGPVEKVRGHGLGFRRILGPESTVSRFVFYTNSNNKTQGHPMDLFLKISVLQAHFCWLGDVEEIIVLGRKVLQGKR